jgi:hypothetical protein
MAVSVSGRHGLWLLPLTMLASEVAHAEQWTHSISAPTSLDYDTNLPMTTSNKRSVTRAIIVPTYNFAGTFGNDEYKLGLGARIERSSDKSVSDDREDPNLSLGWRRMLEKGEFGLNYRFEQASSRTAEFEETGARSGDGTRTTHALGGSWRHTLSDRNTLTTGLNYQDVSFKDSTSTSYTNTGLSLSYGHQWSERIEPFVFASAGHYEPKSGSTASSDSIASSDFYTLQGGVNFKVGENLSFTAQLGMGRVDAAKSDTGWLGSIDLRYAGSRYDYSLAGGRAVTPSGEGGFVGSYYMQAAWSYSFSGRTRLGLDASWRDSKGTQPNIYSQAGAWASYDLSHFWSARAYAAYKERREDGQSAASGNVVGLTLTYSHPNF